MIFGRNDLVQDAPISRIDLLLCRNTLMYFNAETQARVLRRFHFALSDDGVLVLGKSEMLITHADLFRPSDVRRRVFHKVVAQDDARQAQGDGDRPLRRCGSRRRRGAARQRLRPRAPARRSSWTPRARSCLANEHARRMLGVGGSDIGREVGDLDIATRPVELLSRLERVAADRAADQRRRRRVAPAVGRRSG